MLLSAGALNVILPPSNKVSNISGLPSVLLLQLTFCKLLLTQPKIVLLSLFQLTVIVGVIIVPLPGTTVISQLAPVPVPITFTPAKLSYELSAAKILAVP